MSNRTLVLVLPLAVACTTADPCADLGAICTIAGIPQTRALGPEGVPATESELSLPVDATYAPDGRLYLIDWNNHRLRRIGLDGTIETFAGTGFLGDGPEGSALDFAYNHPTNLDFDPRDATQLYVSAWHNSRINVIDLTTGEARFEAGTGGRSYAGDGGPAKDCVLDLPSSLAFEDDGSYYITDQANMAVRYVDTDGIIVSVAGTPPQPNPEPPEDCPAPCLVRQTGWSGDGGPADEAKFTWSANQAAYPGSRAERAERTLYIADTLNHVVRKIDLDTMVIDHVAGTGMTPGYAGDGGPAAEAQLDTPSDVAIAPDGTVYVADTENSCVRAIDTSGAIHTVAGICGEPGYEGEGVPATEARMFHPYGVEVSPDGSKLVIADTENEIFRAVTLLAE